MATQEPDKSRKDHQLLMFYSHTSPLTRRAAPCIARIDKKLGYPIYKLESNDNEYNKMLYRTFNEGGSKCHGYPFFFNKDNGDYTCGFYKCSIIEEWAQVPIEYDLDPKY